MSSRKEEERNEKIIRGLMKLPPNRRCINCNSLGPQYVCTNFWTFVCMTCSGIHREFTHRVKSVSMSKFTTQEVEALQEGGNQRARETFLKDWDPRGQRLPENSNVDKVREFIKSVYVDKKFFASKASGKPPRDTLNIRNHEDETRRASSYHSYSQSPPYDYQYEERRYGKQAPALTKKPGSDRGMFRFLSTSRLSDHGQEDGFANEVPNARVSDFSVSSAGDPFRPDTQSPTRQRDFGFSSPSSEDVRQFSVNTSSNPKAKGDTDQVTNAQISGSSGSFAQFNGDGMSFSSVDSVDKDFIAPTPEQSVVTQHNKDSTRPSSSHSSQSGKFDGLDLFSLPYAPQSTNSSAPEPSESAKFDGLDLFSAPYAPQSTTSPTPEPSVATQHNKDAARLSLPHSSGSGKFDGLDLFSAPQSTNSSAPEPSESAKFDGLDLFSAPYAPQSTTSPTPEPSVATQHNKDAALLSLPHSSGSGKFDGLDLFSAPQSTTSAPPAIDLFELSATSSALPINTLQPPHNSVASTLGVNQQFQAFQPSSLDLFSAVPQHQSSEILKDKSPDMFAQKDEGWATFDMPWHVEPTQGVKSSINVSETSTSAEILGNVDQAPPLDQSSHWSYNQDFSAGGPSLLQNPWHGGLHDLGDPLNAKNNQSWSPFEESTTSFQNIHSEQVPVQDPSVADAYLAWGISEDGAQSHGLDTKSRNPFDLPTAADLESTNIFLDMSSLQSALPNHSMPTPWFPESASIPYTGNSQDPLAYMAGQAPSMQIPNIQSQGPVASISGNPFG